MVDIGTPPSYETNDNIGTCVVGVCSCGKTHICNSGVIVLCVHHTTGEDEE